MYIYALLCPDTLDVKYVGKTIDPKRRYSLHISYSKTVSVWNSRPLHEWINLLLIYGKKPVLHLIEEVNDDNWKERERFWINEFKNTCLNLSHGGSGEGRFKTIKTHWNSFYFKDEISITVKDIMKNIRQDKRLKEKYNEKYLTTKRK